MMRASEGGRTPQDAATGESLSSVSIVLVVVDLLIPIFDIESCESLTP